MSEERRSSPSGSGQERQAAVLQPAGLESANPGKLDSWRGQWPEPPASAAKTTAHILPESERLRILEHLDLICTSPSFEASKRCQQFLRYIVAETIEGRGDSIKERNIAHEVFGKSIDFEPGEDSLVRVKARELRKRLAEYYRAVPAQDFHIDVPLGGYTPRIHDASQPTAPLCGEDRRNAERSFNRRRLMWMLGGSLGAGAGAASLWPILHHPAAPLERLWRPVFATKAPLVIFIPILTDKISRAPSDQVGIGPAMALRRASDFLDKHRYPYHLRFGSDLTFAQLREQPSLLLGGFSSIWTHLMTRNLRFSLQWNESISDRAILDTQSGKTWKTLGATPEGYADQDYGLLCRLFDKESGQIAMIAGGITTFGTEAAAAVFFGTPAFDDLIRQAPKGWETKNFEAVVHVSIIGATPGSPQLVASHFW